MCYYSHSVEKERTRSCIVLLPIRRRILEDRSTCKGVTCLRDVTGMNSISSRRCSGLHSGTSLFIIVSKSDRSISCCPSKSEELQIAQLFSPMSFQWQDQKGYDISTKRIRRGQERGASARKSRKTSLLFLWLRHLLVFLAENGSKSTKTEACVLGHGQIADPFESCVVAQAE